MDPVDSKGSIGTWSPSIANPRFGCCNCSNAGLWLLSPGLLMSFEVKFKIRPESDGSLAPTVSMSGAGERA